MPGAGKTTAIEYLSKKGIPKVHFGGVVIEAIIKEGLEINETNSKLMRKKIRLDFGKDIIVNKIITQIEDLINAGQKQILADGLYTWTEYKILKKVFARQITVVGIATPRIIRHKRLASRDNRPLSRHDASTRDWSEIEELEKGGPFAIADYYITNDGTIEEYYSQIDNIVRKIDF